MNKKEVLAGATFLVLYTGFIFAGFSWMLSSKTEYIKAEIKAEIALVKGSQVRLEKRMDHLEKRIDKRMDHLEKRMDRIESMLGQILVAQNIHHKSKFKKTTKTAQRKTAQRKTASHLPIN